MRVFVYYNLHRKLWSVKALEGPNKGRVIDRCASVALTDVVPKVSEAGRQRVLREKRKNVHAGLVGTLAYAVPSYILTQQREITYNPYRGPTFFYRSTGDDFKEARWAMLLSDSYVHEKKPKVYAL